MKVRGLLYPYLALPSVDSPALSAINEMKSETIQETNESNV